ncbi:hypothetical protein BG004_002761, partial [Podila humilis]
SLLCGCHLLPISLQILALVLGSWLQKSLVAKPTVSFHQRQYRLMYWCPLWSMIATLWSPSTSWPPVPRAWPTPWT